MSNILSLHMCLGTDQGLCDSVRRRRRLLQESTSLSIYQ